MEKDRQTGSERERDAERDIERDRQRADKLSETGRNKAGPICLDCG